MCKIFVNPLNTLFNKTELEDAYRVNSDGTGLYYWNRNTGKAIIKKWAKGTPFEQIWKVVSHLHQHDSIENVAIHFRFGTSGGIGYDQTHPIHVNKNTWIMHNGVCPEFEWNKDIWSDTQCMAFFLKGLIRKGKPIRVPEMNKVFEWNKVVILDKEQFYIINDNLGEWGEDGIWRSFVKYGQYSKPVLWD